MTPKKLFIKWSGDAINDLRNIYYDLLKRNSKPTSSKIRDEIFAASRSIVFPEQFQVDEYRKNFRRIIVRNYKVLYVVEKDMINIVTVIDSRRNPY
jgi:plasmid stabilization system protein ParE